MFHPFKETSTLTPHNALRETLPSLWDCPGLKPEQILCERFQKSFRYFLGTVARNDPGLARNRTIPDVMSATMSY